MLLSGMKATKKRVCFVALAICIGVSALLFGIVFKNYNMKQYPNCDVYYKKMLSLFETSNELAIIDVFDFDFDKAYVANEVYGDEEYFVKALNVHDTVDIPTLESGAHNRILFVKDNVIVYDFIYEMHKINIDKTGIWIFPDTTIIQKSGKETTLYLEIK